MEKLFNRILVPFHLWKDADPIIRQAIEMANQMYADIYLLHLTKSYLPAAMDAPDPLRRDMRERYQPLLGTGLSLTIADVHGATEQGIIGYCRKFNIDLIFLCRKTPSFLGLSRPFFPVNLNQLLKKLKCPVLKTGPDPAIPPIKNIVLSIGDYLPVRKLLFATYLARRSRSTIHLVSVEKSEGTENMRRSYRLLRENTDLPVECLALPGQGLADAAWSYAKRIKADLILIQSGKESHLSGPLHAFGNRFLFNASKIPVLMVP
jgi:nucleotide-binding universal stress UspA family protein